MKHRYLSFFLFVITPLLFQACAIHINQPFYKEEARNWEQQKPAQVPLVVPVEFENGPDSYGINPKAEITVLLCNEGQVKANFAFAAGQLKKKNVEQIVGALPKILE